MKKNWLPYLVPTLLVVVALNQIVLAKTSPLTPWKGGGFGMFSSIQHRDIRFFAVGAESERQIRFIERGRARRGIVMRKVRQFPSDAALAMLAEQIAGMDLPRLQQATALRIEIWRARFDGDTSSLHWEKWREHTHEITRDLEADELSDEQD